MSFIRNTSIVLAGAVVALMRLLRGPDRENDNVAEIQQRLQQDELHASQAEQLEVELAAQFLERLDEEREIIRVQNERARQARLQTAPGEHTTEARLQVERRAREAEENKKKEVEKQMLRLRRREHELKVELVMAKQIAEQERAARVEAEKANDPFRGPTREQFHRALQVTQYDAKYFHFAVVGRSGSGKSSLINAFRNLRNKEAGAAETGTRETTLEIGRYPDPGEQPPRKWIVWFDVPGAGTHRISHDDYFINQGLYMFDLIIVAIGDRFEEIDARILENCDRFKIPSFVVRSKADMHILNSMKEYGDYERIEDNPACYEDCKQKFIRDTQNTVDEEMIRQGLAPPSAYIVSRDVLRRTCHESLRVSEPGALRRTEKNAIHENLLVDDLLIAAAQKRCEPSTTPLDWAKNTYSAVVNSLTTPNDQTPAESQDFGDFFAGAQEQPSQPSRNTSINRHPTQRTPNVRKVIYPRKTNSGALYDELVEHAPELENMLVGQPKMLTTTVAMLTFYPLAPIPREIFAFGQRLQVKEYEPKKKGQQERVETAVSRSFNSGGGGGRGNNADNADSTTGRTRRGRGRGGRQ